MMWKLNKKLKTTGIVLVIILASFVSCKQNKKQHFSYNPLGYYYKTLAFYSDTFVYRHKDIVWLSASFQTQADSVFWDSFNNLNDNFFIEIDSSTTDNFLKNYLASCSVLDSACLLMKPSDFFKQQFKTDSIPYFGKNDTVVKLNIKVKQILTPFEFAKINQNLQKKEELLLNTYLQSHTAVTKDSLGFFWLHKPKTSNLPAVEIGDALTISYQGSFLNGRFLEKSPTNFEFIYGTPDQLLKGLNYVISYLKKGQNAKIILSSRLAFGANGSSNQTVPPFTPLIYEIKIIDLKKQIK